MSLIKQLWIGIALLLLFTLGGTFVISLLSAKIYLQEQLRLKNIDNANTLALSMSQMDKDPVAIELFLTAQFDAGHYEYIIFNDPNKKPIVAHSFDTDLTQSDTAPAWFGKLAKLDAAPGIAQVQDGWQQYGTLLVKSHSRYALDSLWHNARDLFDWFIVATLLSGLIGSFVLKYISRPLDVVVQQAEAIGERRFITTSEPKTKEFRRLVRAMNTLSEGVQTMLEKETRQLEILRRDSQFDLLTGMANRAHFLNLLESKLTREDSEVQGVLAIARVMQLANLNVEHGHAHIDQLLRDIAGVFHQIAAQYPDSQVGRLNGSDFAIVIPTSISVEVISAEISQALNFQLLENSFNKIALPLALINYHSGQERQDILRKMDGALAQAELKGNRAVITLADTESNQPQRNLNEWRTAILNALESQHLTLGQFPVRQVDEELLHIEAPLRLQLDQTLQPAGYFVPWATRLGLMPMVDLAVLQMALAKLVQAPQPIAINVSADALCDAHFREQALKILGVHQHLAASLWLEFSEICALRHMEEFRQFATQLRQLGCKVGMEHVGLEFTQFRTLQDIGLSYLKVDSALVRNIEINVNNQQFLQGLCQVGHSLGMLMIGEGVSTQEEQQALFRLGIDAVTGPVVS
jgi:EAL domain-containing protein (putative c-di-GMP-specific phosphodiesterase class I)/GGDEF domain-containing protein